MIKKGELIIRNMERSDVSLLKSWDTEEARGSFQEHHFKSLYNWENIFQMDGFNSERFKVLLIETTEEEKVGLIYISFIRDGLVSLGIVICNVECRDKGYGTKATQMIVKYLFDNYPLSRIQADTDIENIPAQKVLERAGFKREGIFRNYRFHHGKWHDSVIYSILPDEC